MLVALRSLIQRMLTYVIINALMTAAQPNQMDDSHFTHIHVHACSRLTHISLTYLSMNGKSLQTVARGILFMLIFAALVDLLMPAYLDSGRAAVCSILSRPYRNQLYMRMCAVCTVDRSCSPASFQASRVDSREAYKIFCVGLIKLVLCSGIKKDDVSPVFQTVV